MFAYLYYALHGKEWDCVDALLKQEKLHVHLNVVNELKNKKDRKKQMNTMTSL